MTLHFKKFGYTATEDGSGPTMADQQNPYSETFEQSVDSARNRTVVVPALVITGLLGLVVWYAWGSK